MLILTVSLRLFTMGDEEIKADEADCEQAGEG
jgi:hypothetical protein